MLLPVQVLYSLQRATACTNQRVGFSIEACGRHLATGGCDGCVRVSWGALASGT